VDAAGESQGAVIEVRQENTMSTGIPDFITLEGPLYANALVTAERARNEKTESAAVVLRAPAGTAECLKRATDVLRDLSGRDSPSNGLPNVIPDIVSPDGERVVVLDELSGEPARDRLSRLDPLPETAVLAVAQGHTQILATLGEAGYSGFRPWTWEVWWDEKSGDYAFLGWEWLVKGRDAAGGDVRAAAALWIELATCVPPTPDLMVDWGPETWLALPLGMRRCLYEIWQGGRGFTADEMETRLSEWSRQMTSTPAEQLAEGLRLLEDTQTGEALEWLDRAKRVKSPPREVRRAYSVAASRLTGYVDSLLYQARKEVAGYYPNASRTLSRVIGLPHVDPQLMLTVHRWHAAAQALSDAAVKLPAAGAALAHLSVFELLEQPLLEALGLADAGDVALAIQQVEACTLSWEKATGILIPQLRTLHAELRLPGLWLKAEDAELKGQFDRTIQVLSESLVLEGQIPYAAVLHESTGRLPAQSRRTIEIMRRFARAAESAQQARENLEQNGDIRRSADMFEHAAALTRDFPDKYVEYTGLAEVARCRSAAIRAGIQKDPLAVSHLTLTRVANCMRRLQSLAGEETADSWTSKHLECWKEALLRALPQDDAGTIKEVLLARWPEEKALLESIGLASHQAQPESMLGREESPRANLRQGAEKMNGKQLRFSDSKTPTEGDARTPDRTSAEKRVWKSCLYLKPEEKIIHERIVEIVEATKADDFAVARTKLKNAENIAKSREEKNSLEACREYLMMVQQERCSELQDFVEEAISRDRLSSADREQVKAAFDTLRYLLPDSLRVRLRDRWVRHISDLDAIIGRMTSN
jgi:hypothetical protein